VYRRIKVSNSPHFAAMFATSKLQNFALFAMQYSQICKIIESELKKYVGWNSLFVVVMKVYLVNNAAAPPSVNLLAALSLGMPRMISDHL
jgi:hypothetical protein